ncbi:hypothetical protein GX586_15590 [bacterium]|nr:hypothetical protein [bacterium]
MNKHLKRAGILAAFISFALCFLGGIWILTKTGLDHGNDALSTGIGLYFIGKAFFVGPALLIAAMGMHHHHDGNVGGTSLSR